MPGERHQADHIRSASDIGRTIFRNTLAALAVWTVLLAGSLALTVSKQRETTLLLATNTARSNFNKDVAYRLWASDHGGVYVTPTDKTPPSPWLTHLPDRDLTAVDGRLLTLMNPAYMLREMMQDYDELYGIKGRIVGIVALNPANLADAWEAEGIRRFEKGEVDELMEVSDIDGAPYLRLFKPFRMEQSCQKCHGHLGFPNGSVRGGIGVSVPLAPYRDAEAEAVEILGISHVGLWLVGLGAILVIARRARGRMLADAHIAQTLLEGERHYRGIVETSSDGFWMTDLDGRILEVNNAYAERSGFSRAELLRMRVSDLDVSEDEDDVRRHIAAVMAGRAKRFETRHRAKDGGIWDVEVATSFFAGAAPRLFVFLRDVSERKQGERLLAESERRFREMAETIDQVFFVAEPDFSGFRYVSPAFRRLWGRNPLTLARHPEAWLDWVHPDDRDHVRSGIAAGRGTGHYALEFRIQRPDGAIAWLLAGVFEVTDPVDGSAYILGFHTDISDFKTAEAKLRDKNEALERSNADLEAYAYVASHDLREPLRNITSFSTLLARRLDGRLTTEEEEFVKVIVDAAERMDGLVRGLLELSRVGHTDAPPEPIDLGALVQAARDGLRARIEEAQAELILPDTLPPVMGYPDELYRVFLNLLGNALKYRGQATPRIEMTCAEEDAGQWRLTIVDNGIGIEGGKGYEERIFGLFQRLHQRHEYGGGTGIGLPVCRKIIERHGGRIHAESDGPGRGTRFIFTLPKIVR